MTRRTLTTDRSFYELVILLASSYKEPRRAFFAVFLFIIWMKKVCIFLLNRSYTTSSICILAVGNTPYGKRHTSQNMYVTPLPYVGRNFTFAVIFLVPLTDQFDAFFNPQITSETNATNNTPPTCKKHELSRLPWSLMLNFGANANHLHSDRYQPLSGCTAWTTQRSLRVRGCTITELQEQLFGMQQQQGVLFRGLLAVL